MNLNDLDSKGLTVELLSLIFVESPLGLSIIFMIGIVALGIEGYRSS